MPRGRGMQVDIHVEPLERALREVMPRESDIPRILREVQMAALHFWKKKAQEELRSTSRDYVMALGPGETKTRDAVSIVLASDNPVVDMIENGFKGGDMRTWMLKSSKARTTKSGAKLLVIPFRHAAPGASGRNTGSVMPDAIHNAAKRLLATISSPKTDSSPGGTSWVKGPRGRLGMGSQGVLDPQKRVFGPATAKNASATQAGEILATKQREWHKSSIFLGMIRKGQPTKSGMKTSGFTTFRTISSNPGTDPRSWFHPGIRARHFAHETQDYIGTIVGKIVGNAVRRREEKAGG
jgi:hypothetical protein